MSQPVLAARDALTVKALREKLPQALLIVSEPGLEGAAVASMLAHAIPSDVLLLEKFDKKTTISTDQTRGLVAALRTQATTRRVVLIPRAEQMTEQAQNVLLKALEEPGANTHFVMVVETSEQLLATIISRCSILTLGRTTPAQDMELVENSQLDAVSKQQLTFLAAGRPALLKLLIDQPKVFDEYKMLAKDAKIVLSNRQSFNSLKVLQLYGGDKPNALRFFDILFGLIHFQIQSGQLTQELQSTLEKVEMAERSVRANGSLRLALLQIVL